LYESEDLIPVFRSTWANVRHAQRFAVDTMLR